MTDRVIAVGRSIENKALMDALGARFEVVKAEDGREAMLLASRLIAEQGGAGIPIVAMPDPNLPDSSPRSINCLVSRLQSLLNNVHCGISAVIFNETGVEYLFSNDMYYGLLGYTREQYASEIGENAMATIHPLDREHIGELTRRVYETGQPETAEYRALKRDGSTVWLRSGISMASFEAVTSSVQLSTYADITLERSTALSLKEAGEQQLTMVNDMPGGFCRMRVCADGSLQPILFNEGLGKLLGRSLPDPAALQPGDVMIAVHPDDVPSVQRLLADALASSSGRSCRFRLKGGSGDYVWVRVTGRATTDAAGDRFLSLYYTDASGEVNEEQKQKELLDNLPHGAALYVFNGSDTRLVHRNRRYWELVGRNAVEDDDADLTIGSALHPEDLKIITREAEAAIEQKRDFSCIVRLLCGEAVYKPFRVVGRILQGGLEGQYSVYISYTPVAEDSLSFSETLPFLLSAIMEASTDLAFAKDGDLKYICASRAFARTLGLENERSIIGKTDFELYPEAFARKFREDDQRLLENGEALIDFIEALPSFDGKPHYSKTSKFPLRDGNGKIIGLYGLGRDITRVLETDSQLRLMTDSMPGGLVTYAHSPQGIRITYCNDGFCTLFGGTRENYEARERIEPIEWVVNDDKAKLVSSLEYLRNGGERVNCVFRVHVSGGTYRWINCAALTTGRQGDTVYVNAVLLDITERQEAIEQLRISEQENRLAMQHSKTVVCRYSIAERLLVVSPDVAQRFGRPERMEDVPYAPVREGRVAPMSQETYVEFYESIIRGVKSGSAVFQSMSSKGWRWLEARFSTVFSDDGEPVSAVISYNDVTEQLEKEAAYKRWQQSFQDRRKEEYSLFRCNISKNTSFDIEEGSLLHIDYDPKPLSFDERTEEYVKQCVFEDDREKYLAFLKSDAMLANFHRGRRSSSLDFREKLPKGGYRWLRLSVNLFEYPNSKDIEADLMFENIDREKRSELATIERAQTDPLTGILNRTAFAERVDAALKNAPPHTKHALLMLDIDGFKLVNDVLGHGAGDRALVDIALGLRSVLRRGDLVGRLGGDEFLVFLNDIPNETAASGKAKRIIALTRKSYGSAVRITGSVGIALAPYDGESYDELYEKVDAAMYHVKGTGRNSYAFYSADMRGMQGRAGQVSPLVTATEKSRAKRRMLIVSDSKIDCALLESVFEDEFTTERAMNSGEALGLLRRYARELSVILLNLVMTGMDGFALLERLKVSAEPLGIPIVVVSADESHEACIKAIMGGASDFVPKPYDPEFLSLRVSTAIIKAENERKRYAGCVSEFAQRERLSFRLIRSARKGGEKNRT